MMKFGQALQAVSLVGLIYCLVDAVLTRRRLRANGANVPARIETNILLITSMIIATLPGAAGMSGRVGIITGSLGICITLYAVLRRADTAK